MFISEVFYIFLERDLTMKIESYKSHGKTKYRFRAFLGKDVVTGKQHRVFKSGFDTRKEAEMAYLELTTLHKPTEKSKATFRQVYEIWLDTYRLGVKESTLKHVEQIFSSHILPVFGHIKIGEISPPVVQQFVNHQFETVITANKRFMYLKKVFKFAKKQGYIHENPTELVDVPRRLKKKKKTSDEENFYTKEELLQFLDLAKEKLPFLWFVFFRLLAYTGLRKGEALALTWDDITLDKNTISINKTVSRGEKGHIISDTPKTYKSNRIVLIDKETASFIDKLDKSSTYVFPNSKGSFITPSQPVRQLHRVVDNTDLKYVTPHGFRHTHCSMLFSARVSIPEVQDRLGHEDVKTTLDIYNHLFQQDKEDALNRFLDYLK